MSKSKSTHSHVKPPNILVYTEEKEAESILKQVIQYQLSSFLSTNHISDQIERAVQADSFVIYPVTVDTLLASASSWGDNTQLVVLESRLEASLVSSVQVWPSVFVFLSIIIPARH